MVSSAGARPLIALVVLAVLLFATPTALAAFPYARPGADTTDFTDLYLTNQVPDDLEGDSNEFKYAASPDPANVINNVRPTELGGVRGASVVDRDASRRTAWKLTTGRPDVKIAVLDSGIRWDDKGAMRDLARKTALNAAELPRPEGCAAYDCNGDGVFNLDDYANDSRIDLGDARRVGPAGMLVPQDLLIAFSDGSDADSNGYVDDIVGWDFLDDDNDPFDDVAYGHGTGEATGSAAEADNGTGAAGSCPNCTVMHMRVGDSFIADVNRFAAAVTYAVDNGALIVQEALGSLNNSNLAREAVAYAYRHGVTTIASAADEAAQHNNWPSSLPGVILVNSVTRSIFPAPDQSYLAFNGCTNFNSKITLAIPSTSCSSDAVGVGSGLAGLIYSAARTAADRGALDPHPSCRLVVDGPDPGSEPDPCLITANEVRQLMASGGIGGRAQVDDVDFSGVGGPGGAEPNCVTPIPTCTDPNGLLLATALLNRPLLLPALFNSYPARDGHDQFYGYGRVNMVRAVGALLDDPETPRAASVPPEVEIASPSWYEQVDPALGSFEVHGEVFARGDPFTCRVLVAPGHYPDDDASPNGDFRAVAAPGVCDGETLHTEALDGALAEVSIAELQSYFPADAKLGAAAEFTGRESGFVGLQTSGGRPATDPYGFVVKVVASVERAGVALAGEDRRASFLHRDQDMLTGFPKAVRPGGRIEAQPATPTGDGESSPAFADLDGDNRNELVFAGSDGFVHALRADGTELPGWPVRGDAPGFVASHSASPAYASGAVSTNVGGAFLASVAIGDTNRDGVPEVYGADLEGRLYGWSAEGERIFEAEANPDFSGRPQQPFVNVRRGSTNRTQHGFLGSPVIADLDRDGRDEIVAAGMDRHVYAWHRDGSPVDGFPVLAVDAAKVESVDSATHAVTFRPDAGSEQQGAIVHTPAVGDLDGDGDHTGPDEAPEIVVGTNEEYRSDDDGGFNAAIANGAVFNLLDQARGVLEEVRSACGDPCDVLDLPISPGNSRLYALRADGDRDGDALPGDALRAGWPTRLGIVNTGLLPVVGEGVTGSPVIAPVACSPGGSLAPRVGAMANNGPAYVLDGDGESCYGRDAQGRDIPLQSDISVSPTQFDRPVLPAVGHPAFGDLGGGAPSFVAPAAGLMRALDLALPEYQRSQDFVAAWSVSGLGQFRLGYPSPVNDLQFLTGPSVADIDGQGGEEVIAGTASKDLTALGPLGLPVDDDWPKVTTDWTVANPLIGSFGTLDTDADSRKVVVGMTRSGYLNAYGTDAPACSPSSWPRFHHDNANSGDYSRDAVVPGVPLDAAIDGNELRFRAPGDDLLCGTAERYEVVTSAAPIGAESFADGEPLGEPPAPAVAGDEQSFAVPSAARRYVAIRAVDEQGNVGRPAVVDRGSGGPEPGPDPGDEAGGDDLDRIGCANVIAGSNGGERLVGTGASDRIRGRAGDDRIRGRAGDDCLRGGPGRDRIRGGGGADRVDCGPGRDTAVVKAPVDRWRRCEIVRR